MCTPGNTHDNRRRDGSVDGRREGGWAEEGGWVEEGLDSLKEGKAWMVGLDEAE